MSKPPAAPSDLATLSAEVQLLKEENRHLKQLLLENIKQDVLPKCPSSQETGDGKSHLNVPHASSDPSSCNSSQSLMSQHSSSGFDDPQHFSSDNETSTKTSASYKKRFLKRRLKDKKRSRSLDVETMLQTRHLQDCSLKFEPEEVERSNSIGARRLAPILTITVPSTEEIYQSELSSKDDKQLKDKARDMSRTASIDMSMTCSKLPEDLRMCHSAPSSPKKPASFLYDPGKSEQEGRRDSGGDLSQHSSSGVGPNKNTIHEIQKHYRLLQKRLSQEFSKKIGEWDMSKKMPQWDMNRIRHPLASCRGLSLPCKEDGMQGLMSGKEEGMQNIVSENLSADFRKKLDEWNKMKCAPEHIPQTPHTAPPHFKKLIPDWPKWKSVNLKPELFTSHDLGSNPRSSGCHPPTGHVCSHSEHKAYRVDPGGAGGGGKGVNIAWIDREIQKIEREKMRLDKEKEKCEKKIHRLEKMRLAIGSRIRMKEVLIPTSSGLLRFPGISRKFTQKLYEWEKAQGIGPEASTFALLDCSYQPDLKDIREKFKASDKRTLTRSRSLGSVHDTTKGISRQPSSLSLNDMDELQDASNVTGTDVLCSGDRFSHSSDEFGVPKNLSPTSWTTDCLHILQELFFDLEELEEIESDFSTLKTNLISNKEEMLQITDQLQEYLSDTDKLFNDSNNEMKMKIRGLQQRKDDLFREEAQMQILYITYCNKMINLSEKQVSNSRYVKHISDKILQFSTHGDVHGSSPQQEGDGQGQSCIPSCCIQTELQIADFVNEKASQLINHAKDIRDILKQSEQKLYRNYSNAMESESLQECIHNFNQLSVAMKTDIATMKEYLIPYSPGYTQESQVFKFDTVPGSEDSMDEPMVEFLKSKTTNERVKVGNPTNTSDPAHAVQTNPFRIKVTNAAFNVDEKKSYEVRKSHANGMDAKSDIKSSSEVSGEKGSENKNSPVSQGRKHRKKLRRRRKSDLKRQNSFDKGDDEFQSERDTVLSTDDELTQTREDTVKREPKKNGDTLTEIRARERKLYHTMSKEGRLDGHTSTEMKFDDTEQKHVSLSDLVHLGDGSPILENKFRVNSVTEPGRVCVPTVRKIFTPVVDDTNGNHCVVGYVLRSAQVSGQSGDGREISEAFKSRNEEVSQHLDLNNSLEYIDKSDENDNDRTSSTSLQEENRETPNVVSHLQSDKKNRDSEEKITESGKDISPKKKYNNKKDLSKQSIVDKTEGSKIKSIIEKYNKLTSAQTDDTQTTPPTKPKISSNKIKELSEVFDTDASSKHSSQEIPLPVREENARSIISKIGETYNPLADKQMFNSQVDLKEPSKSPLSRVRSQTADVLTSSHKIFQFPSPLRTEDVRIQRWNKTKLQLAKEQFLSNMACSSHQDINLDAGSTQGTHNIDVETDCQAKPVQKSFSSGMINTLSNSYGKLDKETTKSNESNVTKVKKKTTRSFREKFNTFRLKFKKPKSDKNLLGVGDSCGLSLDTGINDGGSPHSDVSARTSTHSIGSNCSKTSGWRRFFDR